MISETSVVQNGAMMARLLEGEGHIGKVSNVPVSLCMISLVWILSAIATNVTIKEIGVFL